MEENIFKVLKHLKISFWKTLEVYVTIFIKHVSWKVLDFFRKFALRTYCLRLVYTLKKLYHILKLLDVLKQYFIDFFLSEIPTYFLRTEDSLTKNNGNLRNENITLLAFLRVNIFDQDILRIFICNMAVGYFGIAM